jgi:hypothetical protein
MNTTRWKGVIALCSRAQWMPSTMVPESAVRYEKSGERAGGNGWQVMCLAGLRLRSALRKQINFAIVRLSDSGEAKGSRAKWFGN